eukprot:TRINITY_DN3918_c0_g1_i1.p1 TRINITY_DN3918_c0_g1~~TRINITY_DN3918_c0_g1_i1.p1  ORF type:complete len:1073 (-),score=266.71 TRINITY_DN3918_c0_g1_i1:331-3549(-)
MASDLVNWEHIKTELAKIDDGWKAARFDSLPYVVHILTSKDREREIEALKHKSEIIEDVVDEVVHGYHSGFNKAIHNYSQILRLFSESAENITGLKTELTEAKKLLGARNKQLHQLWYRSVTLRHIISLLDQIENASKVPARVDKLISDRQYYAAVQLYLHSTSMLEREGIQGVGALQEVRSELAKLRGNLFYRVVEDLHNHLYNKGEYSVNSNIIQEKDDGIPALLSSGITPGLLYPASRRTRTLRRAGYNGDSIQTEGFLKATSSIEDSSPLDGHDDQGRHVGENTEVGTSDGLTSRTGLSGAESTKDMRTMNQKMPPWLANSTPNEFTESMMKSDAPTNVKYLQTMVECLALLGKVAASGAILSQRLRPTIHELITSEIRAKATAMDSVSHMEQFPRASVPSAFRHSKAGLENGKASGKQKRPGDKMNIGTTYIISPVSPEMAPMGPAQVATQELLESLMDTVIRILENHVIVGELMEAKCSIQDGSSSPKSANTDLNWNHDSDPTRATGGYSLGFCLLVLQSECQQLIREILRATPEAASADAAVQTARLANKIPAKDTRDGSEDGLSFAFRFTDTMLSTPSSGGDGILQSRNRRNPTIGHEGYGTGMVLQEQGIYLTAAVYKPVLQFTDKVASLLPPKYSQLGKDGLQAFIENFVKDHFLPAMFVDYRKCVQQAIASPAAFRPRAHAGAMYNASIENGRPILQGLLAIDHLAKEVLGWAQAMPKYAGELVEYVQTFLERTYERCRTSYMEAVLEKQSYILIGRTDVENLMKHETDMLFEASSGDKYPGHKDTESLEVEMEMDNLLLSLRPIKQESLIRDNNKLVLLAALSDSLEYIADSIEKLGQSSVTMNHTTSEKTHHAHHRRTSSALTASLATLSEQYRSLAGECLRILRIEMQLETLFHLQGMSNRDYIEDHDAEEPEDFIISLVTQITRRDEEMAPFIPDAKRNYIFGGICSLSTTAFIKALNDLKTINLFGVQQICRNCIALEQALAALTVIDSEYVQHRFNRVRTYYELLNMPFEALLAFVTEHNSLFTFSEYSTLLKANIPGRDIPVDGIQKIGEVLAP